MASSGGGAFVGGAFVGGGCVGAASIVSATIGAAFVGAAFVGGGSRALPAAVAGSGIVLLLLPTVGGGFGATM